MIETALVEANSAPPTPAPNAGVPHLTPHEITDILRWDAQGFTQEQIAQKFNPPRSQGTICKALKEYGADSRTEAKRILNAGAAPAAIDILRRGRPADLIKVLEGSDVLSNQDVKGGITIVVGGDARVQVNIGTVDTGVTLSPVDNSGVGESVKNR